jgi:hypothetical protein
MPARIATASATKISPFVADSLTLLPSARQSGEARFMGVIETVKDVAGLIQKYDNIELIRRVVELQEQVYDLVTENRTLKDRLTTRDQLVFRKNSYWRGDDGPFCSQCWDGEGRLVRLHVSPGLTAQCPKCHTLADDPDKPPPDYSGGGCDGGSPWG